MSPKLGYLIEPNMKLQTLDQESLQTILDRISNRDDEKILE
jgi:hypothetical protein